MTTDATLISGPYGTERVPVDNIPDAGTAVHAAQLQDGPRTPLNDVAVETQPGFSEAYGQRMQNEAKPDASALEALGGATDQWITTRVLKRLARPHFSNDTPINQFEYLNELPMHLSNDEREYFIDNAIGQKSAAYAVEQIQDQRDAHATMAEHQVLGMLPSFADPALLATGGVGNLAKLVQGGRLTAAGISGVVQAGLTQAQEGPVSDKEITTALVMGSVFGGVFYHEGKLIKDPEWPEIRMPGREPTPVPPKAPEAGVAPIAPPVVPSVPPNAPMGFGDNLRTLAAKLGVRVEAGTGMSHVSGDTIRIADMPEAQFMQTHGNSADDVLAHELAHHILGHTFEGGSTVGKAFNFTWNDELQIELVKASNAFRPRAWLAAPAHVNKSTELFADGLAMWMRHPELRNQFPRISAIMRAVDDTGVIAEQFPEPHHWIPGLPKILQPWAQPTDAAKVVEAVDGQVAKWTPGDGLQWNMRKTMSKFGAAGKRISDILYDNNSDLSLTSVEAHREAIMSDLREHQFAFEDKLRKANKDQNGYGMFDMMNPFKARAAYEAQNAIEKDVQREMFRRETLARQGREITHENVPEHIKAMADDLDSLHGMALKEMKASKVQGAEELEEKSGYMTRKWSSLSIDKALDKLKATGLTHEAALSRVSQMVGGAVRRANGTAMTKELSDSIGSAIINRALRKGYFEDSLFNMPAGEGQLKEMRDVLKGGGMDAPTIEKAMDVLRVASNDAGKAGYLKHRMDLDYTAQMRAGEENIGVMDLIDNRVSTITDQYIKNVSTNAAFARKGLLARSDVEALRDELLHDTPVEQRAAAKELFDNTIAHFRGDPNGAKLNQNFRLAQAYGRSITLGWSGLWQMTEFANAMGTYGLLKTVKYIGQEMGATAARLMTKPSLEEASQLSHILSENSTASMRLRPYLAQYEDGFEMDMGHAAQLSAQSIGQTVPMVNAMKFVHHFQAKVVGNLITERLAAAAKGDLKARSMLESYGIDSPVMDKLSLDIQAHGMDVDKWSNQAWEGVRPALAKMMDESVLKTRLGDMPAFAAFDNVGKFVFSYRSFVLAAHNKVLAGGIARKGLGAVGLVSLYQFPMTYAAVSAQNALTGKQQDAKATAFNAMGQMGGLGLFSEPLKWASGQSNSVGAPGLIPFDRGIKLFQAGTNLDPKGAGSTALTMLPLVSAIPFIKGVAAQTKGKN